MDGSPSPPAGNVAVPAHRLGVLAAQLSASTDAAMSPAAALDNHRPGVSPMVQPSSEFLLRLMQGADDLTLGLDYDVAEHIPGPLHDVGPGKRYASKDALMFELFDHGARGTNHLLWAEYAQRYGGEGMGSNIVIPFPMMGRDEETGRKIPPQLTQIVLVSNTADCERLARVHVQKQANFTSFLFGSVLSTTDARNWQHQRESFNLAFLPRASLAKVFPISLARAKRCADRLAELGQNGANPVQINEFFLFETFAQLQLAMFGESDEFMERTNCPFRHRLGGDEVGPVAPILEEVLSRAADHGITGPDGCPASLGQGIRGPLAARLHATDDIRATEGRDTGVGKLTKTGNALILEFAGHDTTGHTLSFLAFELARNKAVQARLTAEVDAFWVAVGDRDPVYDDLQNLPYMTRCITETLRLWAVVPQGTFRELGADDYAHVGGKRVKMPKGTLVQILNWTRHRNPDLWGADVAVFNPDRAFDEAELWHGQPLAAYNPHTPRFSPFTHPPRDCIGKNFAQMEMRTIMTNLLKRFRFELAVPYDAFVANDTGTDVSDRLGVNLGTMGPRDLLQPEMTQKFEGYPKPSFGLHLHAVPRVHT